MNKYIAARIMIAAWGLVPVLSAHAGAEGHGGDQISQGFAARGYDAVGILRSWGRPAIPEIDASELEAAVAHTYVKTASSVWVEGPDGKRVERAASNDATAEPPTITVSLSWAMKHPMTKTEWIGLALHEYSGILGVEVDTNQVSAKFLSRLEGMAQPELERAAAAETHPVVLNDIFFDQAHVGMDWKEALEQCERFKKVYGLQYFFVYCTFHQKNWVEILTHTEFVSRHQLLGWERVRVPGLQEMEIESDWRGWITRAIVHDFSGFKNVPIIRTIRVPVPVETNSQHQTYGLRIMGLGALTPGAPEMRIYSSDAPSDGTDPEFFATEREARLECRKHVALYGDGDIRFYKADCRVSRRQASFVYEIDSKNPLLKTD